MFVHDKPFDPNLMFEGKVRRLRMVENLKGRFLPYLQRLDSPGIVCHGKHSSLL